MGGMSWVWMLFRIARWSSYGNRGGRQEEPRPIPYSYRGRTLTQQRAEWDARHGISRRRTR